MYYSYDVTENKSDEVFFQGADGGGMGSKSPMITHTHEYQSVKAKRYV